VDLNIQVSDGSGAAVVSLAGELGPETAPAFRKALDHLCTTGRPVMVDLEALASIDGLGLSILVQAFRQLRRNDGALVIVAPTPAVRRVMAASGAEDFMPICRTRDEAAALMTVLGRQGSDLATPSARPSPSEGTT
jgi:anti-sigma B factor antagonist